MKKICFYLTTRGNYAKTKSIIDCLKGKMEIQYITGLNCPQIEFEGPRWDFGKSMGDYSADIAKITNYCAFYFESFNPDIFVIVADRWECLPAATIAFYMGIPIAHLEGGEESGTIDNKIRHAITQLATWHFPCTKAAAENIAARRKSVENIFMVGATSFDMLRIYGGDAPMQAPPYLLVTFHPGSVPEEQLKKDFKNLGDALEILNIPVIRIGPNIDAGANIIAGGQSFKIEQYAPLLANADCIVGNSSSGIRESSFFGTPAVNMGDRQKNRERCASVIDVPCETGAIVEAVKKQIEHGEYPPDYTYGDGHAGEKIAEALLAA